MSFVNASTIIGQDITGNGLGQSTSFSLDSDVFGANPTDFEVDLEKQQQHHLRQFLYFQGLALQRQEEQRRVASLVSGNSEDIDNLFIHTRTSPDAFSSGSVEDQLQDFVTIESVSDSSVSAPSTPPDILGTNIPSLSGKPFKTEDLVLSPSPSDQAPVVRSNSISTMSGLPASPLNDASTGQTVSQTRGNDVQPTFTSGHAYNHPANISQDVMPGSQYTLYRSGDHHNQSMMFNAPANAPSPQMQAYEARNRSASGAMSYMNAYAHEAMPGVYMNNQPTLYQQPYMAAALNAPGVYDGSMIPVAGGHHQRTFSLPSNNIAMSYVNPANSHPTYYRAQATPAAMEGDVVNVDLQRHASTESLAGAQRRISVHQRSVPYDKTGSLLSRLSLSGIENGGLQMTRATSHAAADPAALGNDSSSESSTPGATVIPDNLKDVPVSMIRNPHGGGRGYIPGETPEDPKKKHRCGICGRGFARLYNLKSHASTHDPARPRPYECPHGTCTRSFSRLHDLERHRQGIHRDGPLMDAKVQGIAPAVARAQNRIAERAANGDLI